MAKDQPETYAIREVSKQLGIEQHVLRYWETEFEALQPAKAEGGQRRYSTRDVATARRIQQLLKDEKYTIAGARQALEQDTKRKQVAHQLRKLRTLLVRMREQAAPPREATS